MISATVVKALESFVPAENIALNEPMNKHTTFRIGGNADCLLQIENAQQLSKVKNYLGKLEMPYFVLGNGSNLLCADGPMDIIAIKTKGINSVTDMGGGLLRIGGGTMMAAAARQAQRLGLAGFEFAHGIPGTVGGGVYMNAGAYGGEMAQVVKSVLVSTPEGEISRLGADELDFSYRHSRFEESGELVLEADIQLYEDDPQLINERMEDLRRRRLDKQPLDRPSAGSAFKRPKEGYAAAMIDQAGLKGFGFGGARVSEKHAGFIVTDGTASCEDVLRTMRAVQEKVYEKFGVTLQPEVRFVGVSL